MCALKKNAFMILGLWVGLVLARSEAVEISMRNLCGEPLRQEITQVNVYWIGFDLELVPQTTLPLKNTSSLSFISFETHRFLIWYAKPSISEEQMRAEALDRGKTYTVGDTNDFVAIEQGLKLVSHDASQQTLKAARHAIQVCDRLLMIPTATSADVMTKGSIVSANAYTPHTLDSSCLVNALKQLSQEKRDTLDFEWTLYRNLKAGLIKYKCDRSTVSSLNIEILDHCKDGVADNIATCEGVEVFDSSENICLNLAPELAEGDQELENFARQGDRAIKRPPVEEIILMAVNQCKRELQEAAVESQEAIERNHHAQQSSADFTALLPSGHSLAKCLAGAGLSHDFKSVSHELSRIRNAKGQLAEPLRNYTCGDVAVGTVAVPDDDVTFRWVAPVANDYADSYENATSTTMATQTAAAEGTSVELRRGRARSVQQLLNRNDAKIFLIDNFVTDQECEHMIETAAPGLQRSTLRDKDNNEFVSQYRNNQAANVMANWRDPDDPVARVVQRVFAFANDHMPSHVGNSLTVDGQEDFNVIQYNPGQEYRPHCDGSCDGSPHLHGGRVATMLMYCKVADAGGATSFTKAGVHVHPKRGQAVFFSYIGENGIMDTELTEHSGCPVLDGEKWVVTQWLRRGVGNEEPWSKFDAVGWRQ